MDKIYSYLFFLILFTNFAKYCKIKLLDRKLVLTMNRSEILELLNITSTHLSRLTTRNKIKVIKEESKRFSYDFDSAVKYMLSPKTRYRIYCVVDIAKDIYTHIPRKSITKFCQYSLGYKTFILTERFEQFQNRAFATKPDLVLIQEDLAKYCFEVQEFIRGCKDRGIRVAFMNDDFIISETFDNDE